MKNLKTLRTMMTEIVEVYFNTNKGNGKMNLKNDITSIDAEVNFLDSNDLTDDELVIIFPSACNSREYQESCSTLTEQLNTVTI